MRQKILFLTVAVLLLAACRPKERSVEFPAIEAATTSSLIIERVELTDSVTTLAIRGYNRPKYWIKVAPATRLIADGKEYEMVGAEGVVPGEKLYMPADGDSLFVLKFAPLPLTTKQFDFSESDDSSDWQIFGIDLTGKHRTPYKKGLPRSVKPTNAKVADLPGFVYDIGETTINIHLLGYRERFGKSINVNIASALEGGGENIAINIDPQTGVGSYTFMQYGTAHCHIYSSAYDLYGRAYVAPGETVDIYCDLSYINSMLTEKRSTNKPKMDITPLYSKGSIYDCLNNLSADLESFSNVLTAQEAFSVKDLDYWKMNADQTTDRIIRMYNDMMVVIEQSVQHPLVKRWATAVCRNGVIESLIYSEADRDISYRRAHNISFYVDRDYDYTPEPIGKEHIERILQLFDMTDPMLMICDNAFVLAELELDIDNSEKFGNIRYLKPAVAAIKEARNGRVAAATLAEMQSWDEPFFARAVEDIRQRTEALLAANSDKISIAPDVPLSQLFDAIIAPHKGKIVVVDFWNTWCSPCCNALKKNEPYKSGELASDDIVWIYIADESSPITTYLDMIPSIKGIHYRLNKEQMNHICGKFGIRSIPSYVFVKRDGSYALTNSFRDHDKMVKTLKQHLP